MSSNESDSEPSPDEEIREVIEETARQRRLDALKFIGVGIAATALAWGLMWLASPIEKLGNVERTIVLVLGYGGYFVGALSTLSGLALLVNSLTLNQ